MKRTLQELAELSDQLRRFRSPIPCPSPPGAERLAVAGRLVARLGGETGCAGTTALGETAVGLARAAGRAPAAVDGRLLGLLAVLADLLEDLLGAVDDGREPELYLARQDWDRFRPAQTAREARADADSRPGPVLLLVASEFRSAVLRDRFDTAGVAWEKVADPEAALARLTREPRPRWVVCDDQAPERHLGSLRDLLAGCRNVTPPLILLAPAATGPDPTANLAARLGADHLWREPYDPTDLPA